MDHKRLMERVEEKRGARERLVARDAGYREHMRVIGEAYERTRMDFWCEACGKDFTANGEKQVRLSGRWPVAWYVGLCPLGHSAIRHITDKGHDPYYWRSEMIRRQRVMLADAMLTPDNPRFALVYPEKYREMERMREQQL